MEIIKKYIETSFSTGKVEQFPFFDKKAPKTITFFLPVVGTDSFYKMLLPAMALNKHSKIFRCILYGISMPIEDKLIDDYDLHISEEIIHETDVFVFPFLTQDLMPVIAEVKRIYPEKKIMYQIDFNFLQLPATHQLMEVYDTQKQVIINNIRNVDQIIVFNEQLNWFLFDKLKDQMKGCGTLIRTQPILFNPEYLNNLQDNAEKFDKFRIGIYIDKTNIHDLSHLEKLITKLKKKYGDKIEFVCFGPDKIDVSEWPVTFHLLKDIFTRYQSLYDLNLNLCIISYKNTLFNTTTFNVERYIEMSSLGIPVMVCNLPPYITDKSHVVQHEINGIVCIQPTDWINELTKIMDDATGERLEKITDTAFQQTLMRYDVNHPANILFLEKMFE